MSMRVIYHPVVNKIKEVLQTGNYWHELFIHLPVRTSEEAASEISEDEDINER